MAFTLFRPEVWLDQIAEEYTDRPGTEIAKKMQAGTSLLITVSGAELRSPGYRDVTSLAIPLARELGDGDTRLTKVRLGVISEGEKAMLEELLPGTKFEILSNAYDFFADGNLVVISAVKVPDDRMI